MPDSKFQQIETAFLKTFNEKSFKENLSKEDFERYLKGKEVLSLKKEILFLTKEIFHKVSILLTEVQ